MKKISVKEAKEALLSFGFQTFFDEIIVDLKEDHLEYFLNLNLKLLEVESLSGLLYLYRDRDLLLIECNYYDPDNINLYYKYDITKDTIDKAKRSYNIANKELKEVQNKIETLEITTYIEIE